MVTSLSQSLSPAQRQSLEKHEAIIDQKLNSFLDVGNALKAIHDERLYRESHASFGKYLADRWDLQRTRAYQLIDAAKVAAQLKCHDRDISPRVEEINSEWQLRALKDIATDRLPAVIDKAAALSKGSRLSAKILKQAARELLPQSSAHKADAADINADRMESGYSPPDGDDGSSPGPQKESLSDAPALRARAALPEVFKKLRYYLGNLGLGDQVEAEITSLMRKAQL